MAQGDQNLAEDTKTNAGRIALGAFAAIIIVAGIAVLTPLATPEPPVLDPAPEPVTAPQITEAEPEPEPLVEDEVVHAPAPPVFDTFRVETDGSMVVAGRAEPGQIVDIMLADEAIARVTADGSGSFVALPQAGPSDQPRKLTLLADPEGAAIASETSFIVSPISEPQLVVAQLPEPAVPAVPSVDASPEVRDDARAGAANQTAPPPLSAAAAAPTAPTVLQADAGGVRVIQAAPSPTAPVVDPNVALDAITYDPEGEVRLSGRAIGDGSVQVYLNNQPVTTSPVTEGGDWQIDLPDIDTGVYTLRIDEVDEEGDVVSRLETPFKREQAEDVAAVLAEETSQEGFEVAIKTVQPGATLWAIAEENLGDGIFYVEVFEANSDLIKDPDLIYPGQIFRIPEMPE